MLFALFIVSAVWGNWDSITRKSAETFHPAETAAEDAKAEADWEAENRVVERHLLTDVVENGDAFIGYDGPQRFFVAVKKVDDTDCNVSTPASVKSAEKDLGFPMKDLEERVGEPIYLVRHASIDIGWEIEQGEESCFVAVTH